MLAVCYAACRRAAKALGYERIITYILETEPGTSLSARGWNYAYKNCGGNRNFASRPRKVAPAIPKKLYEISSESDEISDDDVIKSIASYGSLIAGGKQRIYEFFQSNTGWKDRANFLKNEYGICGASVTVDDKYYSWMADGKGIEYHARENLDRCGYVWVDFIR